MTFRVCIVQAESSWENPGENLKKASFFAVKAASEGADIICFSEQYATGWDPSSSAFAENDEGPVCSAFRDIASEYGLGVLGSFREKSDGCLKNTSVFFDRNGRLLSKYSKIHLFSYAGEDRYYTPGEFPSVFEYGGVKFGIAICYDLRFPELFLAYKKLGAGCILVPAAWPCSRLSHWDLFLRTRAVENSLFMVGINTTGRNPVDDYCGGSMAVSPSGDVISGPIKDEGLLYADIDMDLVEGRDSVPDSLSDRRDELYKSWI